MWYKSSTLLIKSLAITIALLFTTTCNNAIAAEAGSGVYLLGYRVLLPGVMPTKQGLYLRNDVYYYSASASATVTGADITLKGDLDVFADLVTLSYVFPKLEVLNANYSISAIIPVARAKIKGDITDHGQTISNGTAGTSGGGDIFFVPASLGWHWNNIHTIAAISLIFPTGEYGKNKDISIGKNRYAVDPNIAVTWIDPMLGHEISAALGYTINRENSATNYKTGDELHLDVTLAHHFPAGLGLGVGGYYYKQVTSDSGSGAILGPSRGKVFSLGPLVSYTTKAKGHDVQFSLKYFREFAGKDRWSGDAAFFTITASL